MYDEILHDHHVGSVYKLDYVAHVGHILALPSMYYTLTFTWTKMVPGHVWSLLLKSRGESA